MFQKNGTSEISFQEFEDQEKLVNLTDHLEKFNCSVALKDLKDQSQD